MTEELGIATITGRQFLFHATAGYGLVMLDGKWTLVEFSCPLESLPQRGTGSVETQTFDLRIEKGKMLWMGNAVHHGVEYGVEYHVPVED